MKKKTHHILINVIELIILTALILSVPLITWLDATLMEYGPSEISITEISQELLILASALLCSIGAIQQKDQRGFFTLAAGFFGCMFIRECDAFLDQIHHGCWIYPVSITALASTFCALRRPATILSGLNAHIGQKPFAFISMGLLLVLIFSRTFGSSQLWQPIMGENYNAIYKSHIQEGIELLGYIPIAYGTLLLRSAAKRAAPQTQ